MMLMKRQLKYRLLIVALTLFSLFENTLASEQVTSLCEAAFNDQPGSASRSSIIAQELLIYKILLYKISKLIQSGSSNSTTIAALKGELSRRRGALLKIGVPSASMTLSSEDRVQLIKLERGELQLSELINSQQKKQTDSLTSELTTISLRKVRDLKTTFLKVDSVEFSPKENFYLIAGLSWHNGQELKLYDAQTDEEIITLASNYTFELVPQYSSNGEYFAVSSANEFRVWKADQNEEIIAFRTTRRIVSYSFGSGSKTISLIEEDGSITEIDVITKSVRPTVPAQIQGDSVLTAHWKQNNDYVITFESDGDFRFYRRKTGEFSYAVKTNSKDFWSTDMSATFSSDGRYAAIKGNKIIVFDLNDGKIKSTFDHGGSWVEKSTFDPGSRFLVVGDQNGEIRILDLRTGEQIYSVSEHKISITQINFSLSGSIFVSTGQNDPILWRVEADHYLKGQTTDKGKK